MIGLILAIVVEARHWTRIRWDFDDDACARAWQLTFIGIALAAALIWLDGSRYTALPGLLSWLPPLLLPMQFVQAYGMRDSLPLGIFSFLARHRRERNHRLGLTEEITEFNFGNVLFAVTMVSASVGSKAESWAFLPGLVLLTGWILLASTRGRALALIPVCIVAGFMALLGQLGLERAEEWIGRAAGAYRNRFDANFVSTMIGTRGTVQLSPDIVWRLQPRDKTPPPRLLRTATFNTFLGTNWQNQRVASSDFKDLDTRTIGEKACFLLQDVDRAENIPSLPWYSLRGGAAEETPLPLPGDAAGVSDFELDGIQCNSFGTVRVFPKQSVIDGTVYWQGGTFPESPPLPNEDLKIPLAEGGDDGAISQAVRKLRLKEIPDLAGKLGAIRAWFYQDFRYTLQLTIQHPTIDERLDRIKDPTILAKFLNDVRAGHCEYFATAATLMLRDAGVPARYSTGYAVMERDPKHGEWIVRGTHGHAWCRVWDESASHWIDFDPTPADWMNVTAIKTPWLQRFNDGLKRLREDFFIWRNRPNNRLAVTLTMLGIGLGLGVFVIKRLWRSKRHLAAQVQAGAYEGPVIRTPLHGLEQLARKRLGPRPPGQPFAAWLGNLRNSLKDPHGLEEAIALHQQLRFDPASPPPGSKERLEKLARELKESI